MPPTALIDGASESYANPCSKKTVLNGSIRHHAVQDSAADATDLEEQEARLPDA
jgi:hypothetical protein